MKLDSSNSGWENVPPRFGYLSDVARRYQGIQFDSEIDSLIRRLSVDERCELEDLGRRVLEQGDYSAVCEWLNRHDLCKHEEAAAIYFLFGILDAMEIPFE